MSQNSQLTEWSLVVTVLACPQVRYSQMSAAVLSAAAKMGGGKAQPALQLVGYEDEVEAAVKYAFGNALVCQVRGRAEPVPHPHTGLPGQLNRCQAAGSRAEMTETDADTCVKLCVGFV
jgi:hypothetical protein